MKKEKLDQIGALHQFKKDLKEDINLAKTFRESEKDDLVEKVEQQKSSRIRMAQEKTLERRMQYREQMSLHYEEERELRKLKERRKMEAEERVWKH